MQVAIDAPRRPALRYYGGKWKLADWIISFFPDHANYIEPCGGAASVLLKKPRSPLEVYNDIDQSVVNFFAVLRDSTDELVRRIELTPWARAEYYQSLEPCDDLMEHARRFFIRSWMSYNGATGDNPRIFGWRITKDARLRDSPACYDFINHALNAVASRFLGVQIENRDWADVVRDYDNDAALLYLDPPYPESTRTHSNWYAYEWTDEQHASAAEILRSCKGAVIISGYACDLYAELYESNGWQRVDKDGWANSASKRTESLWLSPRTVAALNKPQQQPLFDC